MYVVEHLQDMPEVRDWVLPADGKSRVSEGCVLVLNCGSSSVKLALVDPATGERRLTGLAERVGSRDAVVHVRRGDREETSTPGDPSARGALAHLMGSLTDEERDALVGVGHRVVHGGSRFSASVVVDDATLDDLYALVDLAPLHMPANLLGIETARDALPGLAQVAVFDTAFHQTMPPVAYRYAVPQEWYDEHHVRRYGFHGTSHRFVSARAAEVLGRPAAELRLVVLHLGNGCSAAAVRGGESVDTTMGLTPLEGLVMGTRSGDVDPGLLGYVAERLDLDVAGVVDALNTRSGLLGLSGLSNDMRTVCDAAAGRLRVGTAGRRRLLLPRRQGGRVAGRRARRARRGRAHRRHRRALRRGASRDPVAPRGARDRRGPRRQRRPRPAHRRAGEPTRRPRGDRRTDGRGAPHRPGHRCS